ncbi:uncharacterized protein LOC110884290 isoform X3 [Helianthus annuus]|uniref:uncharacterized protein LOC110884290 isoform X2 n=1 Tax=Helianthus annuus TaxID=4232 RepID=UPI000B90542A|nr:uncharacterized protein LOC110884290 isoform X2 [Helianthus annuus]XP_021987705.1 uncharacterized protein LOC110884290 isoform X3 [Helianthus annuus]
MINEPWVAAAITTDALVADLLLHIKRSSSLPTPAPPLSVNPPGWGDHKSRSKPSAICNSTVGKGQQRRSPSTPFSWSDGYDESSRCSDHRSGKVDLHEDPKRERESGSEVENMKRRRCMLPDLNETPAPVYE